MLFKHTLIKNRVVWLTGASSGIGRALAIELAKRGAKLALSARRADKLEELARSLPTPSLVVPLDVTDRQANHQAVERICQHFGGIDIAIFNAGSSEYIDLEKFDSNVFERMIQINYFSMVYGIEAVLPVLRKSRSPHIVGMSSVAAYGGLPMGEAYGAAKAAARHMLQGLRIHLRTQPPVIPVSIICPGFVRTPLTDRNAFPMPFLINVEKAARIIANGIEKQKEEIYFPRLFAWAVKLISSLPSPICTRLLAATLKNIKGKHKEG